MAIATYLIQYGRIEAALDRFVKKQATVGSKMLPTGRRDWAGGGQFKILNSSNSHTNSPSEA